MISHLIFMQPRGNGAPNWPTDPQPGTPTTPHVNVTGTRNGDGSTTITVGTGPGQYLSQEMCESANRNGLIAAGGYTFGVSMLSVVIFVMMRKRLWGTAFSRSLTAVLTAATLSSALVAWDPARADVLQRCLDPLQGFTRYVFLGDMLVARALVLGLVPSVLVTLTGCFIAHRV